MSTVLQLKKRQSGSSVTLDTEQLHAVLNLPAPTAKDRLYDMLSGLMDSKPFIHDKRWLEQIVNFIAVDKENRPVRVPLTEQTKWLKLATRIGELDDSVEGDFTLSDYQETILWERLNNEEFTVTGMPQAFASFLLDFLETTGRRFADMEPKKSVPEDKILDGPTLSQDEPAA